MKNNVYLISSSSFMLIKEELNKILKEETNVIYGDYQTEGIDFFLEEAAYFSLFDEKKYIIVKNATLFDTSKTKEEDLKKLEKYLNNPNPNTVLIFYLTTKPNERKKITKIIKDKYQYISIKDLTPKDLITKIISIFKHHNFNIDYESVRFIASSTLNNYDLACKEIEKILTYYDKDDKNIAYNDIINLIPKTVEENIFRFSDAVVNKETKKMFELLNDLKQIKEEPVVLINTLAREYRLMYKCFCLNKDGLNTPKIAQELGIQPWQVEKALKNSYNYRPNDLLEKLSLLSDLDIAIKSGSIDKYLGIELFLLDI